LAYNPKNRLSAESALKHPFFSSEPLPCEPHQIQKLTKEYHDYMIRSMNKEREKKLYKERLEQERKEQETYRRKWDEKKKDNSNASSFKRLASLFGPQKDQEEEESSSSSEDEDIPPGDHLGKRRP
jgi:serine/threonine protein kinase